MHEEQFRPRVQGSRPRGSLATHTRSERREDGERVDARLAVGRTRAASGENRSRVASESPMGRPTAPRASARRDFAIGERRHRSENVRVPRVRLRDLSVRHAGGIRHRSATLHFPRKNVPRSAGAATLPANVPPGGARQVAKRK